MDLSPLQRARLAYVPSVPSLLKDLSKVRFALQSFHKEIPPNIRYLFPKTLKQGVYALVREEAPKSPPLHVGVLFSGGQAAGGHNVIAGLFDALREIDPHSTCIGFLNGPKGVVDNQRKLLGADAIASYRNQGGFDLIGSGRTKIETKEQLQAALQNTRDLDGLVVIGGDDSNTNAAIMAEYFAAHGSKTSVVGVPKTIDGDLRSEDLELSFGFDSACKTYAELIGNIAKDAISARKYYHFIKLMGRSASHITLECALRTQPNMAIIAEEGKSLSEIVGKLVDLIERRKRAGKEYGVILVPEGLIEFLPDVGKLIAECSQLLAQGKPLSALSAASAATLSELPESIQKQLTLQRDSHGNVQVSSIETEQLLISQVKKKIPNLQAVPHFLGYEGRACLPTNFDANYGYTLGRLAALSLRDRLTGVIGAIQRLRDPIDLWHCKAIPLVQLIHFEMRQGVEKPVIQKTLVDRKSRAFVEYLAKRGAWEMEDHYVSPGPIQFFGDPRLTDEVPVTL